MKDNWGRSEVIKDWQTGGGVLIMGYEMFRTLSQLSRVKNKKQKKMFTEGLLDPGRGLVFRQSKSDHPKPYILLHELQLYLLGLLYAC